MGRNILSICDHCEVYIFHLRGKESDKMQLFQQEHSDHEKQTRIVSDYVTEQPGHYTDVTDMLVNQPAVDTLKLSDAPTPELRKEQYE